MSRRKQANPRSFKPDTEVESSENTENHLENNDASDVCYEASPSEFGDDAQYSTNSHINLRLTVNTNNTIESDELATDLEASCFSASLDDSPTSSGASSCATPTSASDLPHSDATPYACGFCKKAFPRFSFLKKHEQMHNDQMPFRCEFCSRLFKHKRSRDRHVMLHTGDKKYRCICCEAAFSRSDHLKIHMKTHGTSKVSSHKLSVSSCKMTGLFSYQKRQKVQWLSSDEPNLTCHRINPSEETTSSLENYPCKHCGVCFENITQLQDHISSEHSTSGRGAKLLSSLLDISERSWSDAPPMNTKLACVYCASDIFSTMEQLKLHIQVVHHSILNGEFNEITYADVTRLRTRDLPTKNAEKHIVHVSHSCEVCHLKFPSIQKLQQHIQTVHKTYENKYSRLPPDPYTCGKCLISFDIWNLFAEHCLTVHDGSPNDLVLLPSNSDYSKYLSTNRKTKKTSALEHKKSLTRQYEHGTLLCNQCDAALPNFESFRNHVKSHLEPSPYNDGNVVSMFETDCEKMLNSSCTYSCPHCNLNLSDADECEQHIASHFLATSVEYECKCCMTAFTCSEELQSHVLQAHVQHLYRCSLCKRTFDSKLPLQVHFAVDHSNECQLYRCTACSYTSAMFHSKLEFFLHVRNAHGTEMHNRNESARPKSIECSFCRQQFNTNIEMQFHLTDHIKQFHCKYCPENFHIEYLLDKHVEFCHSDLQVIDDVGFPFDNKSENNISSKSHRKSNKNSMVQKEKYQDIFDSDNYSELYEGEVGGQTCLNQNDESMSLHCTYCGDSCKSRSELENHLKQHLHNGNCTGKYKCNICDEVCSSPVILAEHKLTHCKIISSNNCIHCKAMLTNKEQFYMHLVRHSSNKNISDLIDNDNNNNKHIGNENINNGRKSKTKVSLPTPCIICRQTLVSDIEVNIHSQFHLSNLLPKREYEKECCVCKNYTDNNNVIILNSESRYLCKDCYLSTEKPLMDSSAHCVKCKVVCSPSSLASSKPHMCGPCNTSETDVQIKENNPSPHDKNHECHLCKGVFPSSVDLEVHLIEHTFVGYSSYTCYICSAVFTASHGLRNHILEHGLEARPYDCTNCNLKFYFRAQLENHNFIHEEDVPNAKSISNEIILANQESDNYKIM